jgi:ferredoxin
MKVVIDRSDCTSCGTCYDTCPEFFEEDPDDSFSRIIEKYRLNGDKSQGTPPADAEGCVRDAADLCPAQIIRIEED